VSDSRARRIPKTECRSRVLQRKEVVGGGGGWFKVWPDHVRSFIYTAVHACCLLCVPIYVLKLANAHVHYRTVIILLLLLYMGGRSWLIVRTPPISAMRTHVRGDREILIFYPVRRVGTRLSPHLKSDRDADMFLFPDLLCGCCDSRETAAAVVHGGEKNKKNVFMPRKYCHPTRPPVSSLPDRRQNGRQQPGIAAYSRKIWIQFLVVIAAEQIWRALEIDARRWRTPRVCCRHTYIYIYI